MRRKTSSRTSSARISKSSGRKILRKAIDSLHNCGNGFKGNIVSARGVSFCGFCGKEF